MPQNHLPETGFWTGGGIDQLLFTLIPIIIMGVIAYFAIKAIRSGLSLFSEPAPQELEVDFSEPAPQSSSPAFPGFNPDEFFGPAPDIPQTPPEAP